MPLENLRINNDIDIACDNSITKLIFWDSDTFIIRVDLKPQRVNIRYT